MKKFDYLLSKMPHEATSAETACEISSAIDKLLGQSLYDRMYAYSFFAASAGFVTTMTMDYQSNPSLAAVFAKYVLPVVGAAGLGALTEVGAGYDGVDARYRPQTFKRLGEEFNSRTAKWAVVSTLVASALVGCFNWTKAGMNELDEIQQTRAQEISRLPVLAPNTIVRTTARQSACGQQGHGVVLYKNPEDGHSYQVLCSTDIAPK